MSADQEPFPFKAILLTSCRTAWLLLAALFFLGGMPCPVRAQVELEIKILTNHHAVVSWTNTPGKAYVIQSTTNVIQSTMLPTNWVTNATVSFPAGGAATWVDPAPLRNHLFYRVVQPAEPELTNSRPYTTEFDEYTAIEMIELARSAGVVSKDEPDIRDGRWEAVKFIDSPTDYDCGEGIGHPDTQLFVAQDVATEDIVVSFRGSTRIVDYITDAQREPVDWVFDDGRRVNEAVHKGFSCAYLSIKPELKIRLEEAITNVVNKSSARVYFTGHSLGGALATLAACDLSSWLRQTHGYEPTNVVLYSYGAPRSMRANLADQFRQEVPNAHAVIEKTDIVPYYLDQYTHITNLIVINSRVNWRNKPENARLQFIDGRELMNCGPPGGTVPDPVGTDENHSGEYYLERLKLHRQHVAEYGTPAIPDIELNVEDGWMQIEWSGDVQGRCDKVVLTSRTGIEVGEYLNNDGNIFSSEWVSKFGHVDDRQHTTRTRTPKSEHVIAVYIDEFNKVLAKTEKYVARTPELSIASDNGFLGNGGVKVTWSVGDEGRWDYVAVYRRNPLNPDYDDLVGREDRNEKEFVDIHLGSTFRAARNIWTPSRLQEGKEYYAAYVTADARSGGHKRVVKVVGPVRATKKKPDDPTKVTTVLR